MIIPFVIFDFFLSLGSNRPKMINVIGTEDLTTVRLVESNSETGSVKVIVPKFSFVEYVKSQLDVATMCNDGSRSVVDYYKAYKYLQNNKASYIYSAKLVFAYFLIDIGNLVLNTFPSKAITASSPGVNYFSCRKDCLFDFASYLTVTPEDEDYEYLKINFSEVDKILGDLKSLLNNEDIESDYDYFRLLDNLNVESYFCLQTYRTEVGEALLLKHSGYKLLDRLEKRYEE